MSIILQLDDLELGMFVTIHTGKPYDKQINEIDNSSPIPLPKTTFLTREDQSHKGDILEIVAINLPYIIFKRYKRSYVDKNKFTFEYLTLDLRLVKLMKLTDDYVKVLFPELIKK